jgi:hypothetical protein
LLPRLDSFISFKEIYIQVHANKQYLLAVDWNVVIPPCCVWVAAEVVVDGVLDD